QEGTAGAQRYVVHPIVETLLGRDIGGIYPRLLFHEGTVEAVTEQQDGKAEEEKEHLVTSILIWRRPCAELRWPEVQITPQLSAGGGLQDTSLWSRTGRAPGATRCCADSRWSCVACCIRTVRSRSRSRCRSWAAPRVPSRVRRPGSGRGPRRASRARWAGAVCQAPGAILPLPRRPVVAP